MLCLLSVLGCFGCALVNTEKHSLIATVPLKDSCDFRAVLTTSARCIECVAEQKQVDSDLLLRIIVINNGNSPFLAQQADGKIAPVAPGVPTDLYNGQMPLLTNSFRIPVSAIQHSTPCAFRLELSPPQQLNRNVRVYLFISSAPM